MHIPDVATEYTRPELSEVRSAIHALRAVEKLTQAGAESDREKKLQILSEVSLVVF